MIGERYTGPSFVGTGNDILDPSETNIESIIFPPFVLNITSYNNSVVSIVVGSSVVNYIVKSVVKLLLEVISIEYSLDVSISFV